MPINVAPATYDDFDNDDMVTGHPMHVGMDDNNMGGLYHADLAHGLTGGCEPCCGECCLSFWCAECQTNKLHSFLLDERPPKCCVFCNAPTAIFSLSLAVSGGTSLLAMIFAGGAGSAGGAGVLIHAGHHMYVRMRLLQQLGIRESCCCSCMTSFFCAPCSSAQLTDTVKAQNHPVRIFMD